MTRHGHVYIPEKKHIQDLYKTINICSFHDFFLYLFKSIKVVNRKTLHYCQGLHIPVMALACDDDFLNYIRVSLLGPRVTLSVVVLQKKPLLYVQFSVHLYIKGFIGLQYGD